MKKLGKILSDKKVMVGIDLVGFNLLTVMFGISLVEDFSWLKVLTACVVLPCILLRAYLNIREVYGND